MSSKPSNLVILAAAGSRKTEDLIESSLAVTSGRVLITTYTNENQRQIIARIEQRTGVLPPHITVMGWFTFLISQCAKPYQNAITQKPFYMQGLNFTGAKDRRATKSDLRYYFDQGKNIYRDGVSDFVTNLDKCTQGAVIRRLERIYSHIFVDEVQDLVAYDLEVLSLLMRSRINLTLVGDPRQYTFSTNANLKNKQYRGIGLIRWLSERSDLCHVEERPYSYRCNQSICDFADALYPDMPRTTSVGVPNTDHDGIFELSVSAVEEYVLKYRPMILRHDKNVNTGGFPAVNIGVSKGSTFDRVLIFPTKPMLRYLKDRDPSKLKAPEKLYVAVTRARYSVAFVIPSSPPVSDSRRKRR